jgi:hypothetical protein
MKTQIKGLALLQVDIMTTCKSDSYNRWVAKRLQSENDQSQIAPLGSQNGEIGQKRAIFIFQGLKAGTPQTAVRGVPPVNPCQEGRLSRIRLATRH